MAEDEGNVSVKGGRFRDPMLWFTGLLVVVGVLQWAVLRKTDETLRIQQRAWILPSSIVLLKPPVNDQGIIFLVNFGNTGREPALNANLFIQNDLIDAYDIKDTSIADIDVPKNRSCDNGGSSVATTLIAPGLARITVNSNQGQPRAVFAQPLSSRVKYLVVQGCIKYKTLEEERHTSFCYIMQPSNRDEVIYTDILGQPITPSPPPPPPPPFVFVNCRSGFDAS